MANQDEPITNNPLLPFLQIPSKTNLSHPASLTPVETLAAGQQIKEAKLAEEEEGMGEKEGTVKPPGWRICPGNRVLYMKEGEIRLLGLHVSSHFLLTFAKSAKI